tara:strand:- start:11744 stop:12439 length:696 start_codon:yes stop_codon:yes gene_type:complete
MNKILFILVSVEGYKQFNWYYDNRIHNFGNIGLGGKFHAFMAPHTSKIIDKISYDNVNIRFKSIYNCLPYTDNKNIRILDFGCGVGISSSSIQYAFPKAKITGIDCSVSMLNNCPKYKDIEFKKELVHRTSYNDESIDLINCMFLFHEAPSHGRKEIFEEINRILKPGGLLNIMDIRLSYDPNRFMLSGEPFLLDYLDNFRDELSDLPFKDLEKPPVSNRQLDLLLKKIES